MAFNYLVYKKGTDHALKREFDPVRKYIRFAAQGETWPYAQIMYPDNSLNAVLRLTLLNEAPVCVIRFISYIDEFYVDLLSSGELHAWARENLPESVGLL